LFTGIKVTGSSPFTPMVFETAFASFQVSVSGDTATVTDTISGS
jgi:hypothetical protein